MRKVFGYILAAAFLTLASCSKEQLAGEGTALQSGEPRIITLSFNPSTKTTLGDTEGRSPEFEDGDVIRLSNSIAWEERAVKVSDGVATVSTFLGGELKVVYPAAAAATDANGLITGIKVQASQSGRFKDANICMTTIPANANSATLHNQTAVLRFYVDATIGVKSVTVTSGGSNIANEGAHLKQITVDPAGNELISSVTDDPGRRLCYVAVLPGANTSSLTFTGVTTTQGTVVRKPLRTSVTLDANGMYNAFIPYYISVKVGSSPAVYQKWGYCNVGAFLPEEQGMYFMWGEIEGHRWTGSGWTGFPASKPADSRYQYNSYWNGERCFEVKNCPYSVNGAQIYTKYTIGTEGTSGSADRRTVLELMDDAAAANWGEDWRMPTENEYIDLISGTGSTGANFVSGSGFRIEGTQLFFPATGRGDGTSFTFSETSTRYWSSTLGSNSMNGKYYQFASTYLGDSSNIRQYGYAVRAIYNPEKTAEFNPYDDKGNI